MQLVKSINNVGGLLVFTLSTSVVIGCDVESEPVEERAIAFEGSEAPQRIDEDECGFADYRMPASVVWEAGKVPKVAVDVDPSIGSEDRVTLQFQAGRMGGSNIQLVGKPVIVRGSGSFALPEELLALVRSGDQYLALARIEVCEADAPQQNCFKTNTDVINIDDGQFFSPPEYEVFMREKYSATYPWLFENGAGAIIIEGEGD